MEETRDTITWKVFYAYGLEEVIKISMLTKVIYRFNPISFKIAMIFFIELEKVIQKCVKPQTVKAILRMKNKAEASGFLISSYITKL